LQHRNSARVRAVRPIPAAQFFYFVRSGWRSTFTHGNYLTLLPDGGKFGLGRGP
jgi:hypothetical protein